MDVLVAHRADDFIYPKQPGKHPGEQVGVDEVRVDAVGLFTTDNGSEPGQHGNQVQEVPPESQVVHGDAGFFQLVADGVVVGEGDDDIAVGQLWQDVQQHPFRATHTQAGYDVQHFHNDHYPLTTNSSRPIIPYF